MNEPKLTAEDSEMMSLPKSDIELTTSGSARQIVMATRLAQGGQENNRGKLPDPCETLLQMRDEERH